LTPVVALSTKTRSSPRAPRNSPTASAARRQAHKLAEQEGRRLRLDATLPVLLRLQHRARRRAHGAVVQVGDRGIQPPMGEEGTAEGGHGRMTTVDGTVIFARPGPAPGRRQCS